MKATANLDGWQLLHILSQGGGLKKASIVTGFDLAYCTRLIQRLENDCGFHLIDHSVRPAQLSQQAQTLLPKVQKLVAAYSELVSSLDNFNQLPLTIRLGLPVNAPRESFNEHLKQYRLIDPTLRIEIVADPEPEDVFTRRCDVIYLPFKPKNPDLFCWKVGTMINVPFASKKYIEERGNPSTPDSLNDHDVILRSGREYPMTKYLEKGSQRCPLNCRSIAYAGDVPTSLTALLSGDGVALDLSYGLCAPLMKAGLIDPVLAGWHRPEWNIFFACPKSKLGNTRIIHFVRWTIEAERIAMKSRKQDALKLLKSLASP